MPTSKNQLHQASSPYLLQHQNNPVHWLEWNEESLQLAKEQNKPLLISVGYAACHWCHVMAHESFEDEQIADLMNTHFICIKVDREERPDIDQIYMDAAQILTGRGGWPLNAFALPNGKPFYAATYFPKENWRKVLLNIADAYQNNYSQLADTAKKLTKGIQLNDGFEFAPEQFSEFTKNDYQDLYASWQQFIDFEKGGFKGAPKFPMPNSWQFLLQHYTFTNNQSALEATLLHLDEMAKGGIYDQIGGGFARYSVDDKWFAPHFEKMLYDNAQLISLYANAYKIVPKKHYAILIEESLAFVKRELTHKLGGFYASLDADSEGEEGTYYVWTYSQLKEIIAVEDWDWFQKYYQITPSGNWENGKNIIYAISSPLAFAKSESLVEDDFLQKLKVNKQKLHEKRWEREHPGLDDKILTSWNALMLKAYVDAATALQNETYLKIAEKNADFLFENLWNKNQLYRNFKNGTASIPAFLDDYALLVEALIILYQANFKKQYLDWAEQLTEICIRDFYDDKTGLFFYTSKHGEQLIAQKFEMNDNVIPASNSSLAKSLHLLGHVLDKSEYLEASKQMLMHVKQKMFKSGPYFANWSVLAGWMTYPIKEVAIMGENAHQLNFAIQQNYFGNAFFLGGIAENLALLKGKLPQQGTRFYVCENKTCQQPTDDFDEVVKNLKSI